MTRLFTGLELSISSVKMVQICRERHLWRLVRNVEIPFPPGTMDMSNKCRNIQEPEQFLRVLGGAVGKMEGRVGRVGVSLPGEIIKIAVHSWDELPKSVERIHEMIAWKEKGLLPFPVEKARTSFFRLNGMRPGKESLLVAVGSEEIIRDYEVRLRSLRIEPESVQPSVMNQMNFYAARLPASGVHGFLGVLDDYFAFFVFEGKSLIFYRGKRKHALPLRFLQEIAMTIQLYQDENPGRPIGTLVIQSQSVLPENFHAELSRECEFRIERLDETEIIVGGTGQRDGRVIASFASAIGAAQSIAV
ncbi:MAG: hypothetical protein C4576_12830 [Desulfobacteraceae bacterium]|nr:MAG: hypothetical protein C4576_12830 [Desulfobacteraceae bacterium]